MSCNSQIIEHVSARDVVYHSQHEMSEVVPKNRAPCFGIEEIGQEAPSDLRLFKLSVASWWPQEGNLLTTFFLFKSLVLLVDKHACPE